MPRALIADKLEPVRIDIGNRFGLKAAPALA